MGLFWFIYGDPNLVYELDRNKRISRIILLLLGDTLIF